MSTIPIGINFHQFQGDDSDDASEVWNDLDYADWFGNSPPNTIVADLVDTNGDATGIALVQITTGDKAVGRNIGTENYIGPFFGDSCKMGVGEKDNTETVRFKFTGLDGTKTYKIESIYTEDSNSLYDHNSFLTAIGNNTVESNVVDGYLNAADWHTVEGVAPNGSDEIECRWDYETGGASCIHGVCAFFLTEEEASAEISGTANLALVASGIVLGIGLLSGSANIELQASGNVWSGAHQYLDTSTYSKDAWVYKPPGWNEAVADTYPVLIFYHGAGAVGAGSGAVLTDGGTTPPIEIDDGNFGPDGNGDTGWPMVVISPYLVAGGWIASSPAFIDSVRSDSSNLKINSESLFLTGLSLGANPCSAPLGQHPTDSAWRALRGVYPIAGGNNGITSVDALFAVQRNIIIRGWWTENDDSGEPGATTWMVNDAADINSAKAGYYDLTNVVAATGHNVTLWGPTYEDHSESGIYFEIVNALPYTPISGTANLELAASGNLTEEGAVESPITGTIDFELIASGDLIPVPQIAPITGTIDLSLIGSGNLIPVPQIAPISGTINLALITSGNLIPVPQTAPISGTSIIDIQLTGNLKATGLVSSISTIDLQLTGDLISAISGGVLTGTANIDLQLFLKLYGRRVNIACGGYYDMFLAGYEDSWTDIGITTTTKNALPDSGERLTELALRRTNPWDGSQQTTPTVSGIQNIPDEAWDTQLGTNPGETSQLKLSGFAPGEKVNVQPFFYRKIIHDNPAFDNEFGGTLKAIGATTEELVYPANLDGDVPYHEDSMDLLVDSNGELAFQVEGEIGIKDFMPIAGFFVRINEKKGKTAISGTSTINFQLTGALIPVPQIGSITGTINLEFPASGNLTSEGGISGFAVLELTASGLVVGEDFGLREIIEKDSYATITISKDSYITETLEKSSEITIVFSKNSYIK